VFAHWFVLVAILDVTEVSNESVFESFECLTYVLGATFMAGNGVDDVRAPAGDFPHGVVGNSCGVALYTSCFVE